MLQEDFMDKETQSYCTAEELALYVSDKYKSEYNVDISAIKLQKALYFLFAYWGGFVRKSNVNESVEEKIELPEYLFNDRIEAWTYGPVVPDVYRHNGVIELFGTDEDFKEAKQNIKKNPRVVDFIDDLLKDIFSVSDFRLVDISHQDKCWLDNYNESDEKHNNEIPKDAIINEYLSRV